MKARTSAYRLVSSKALCSARVCGDRGRHRSMTGRTRSAAPRLRAAIGSQQRALICAPHCGSAFASVSAVATVSARTSRAPASFRTQAQASSVAPVVLTSSTRMTTPTREHRLNHAARHQRREAERAAHVPSPRARGETGLRRRESASPQRVDHGKVQRGREIGGLIEAAMEAAPRVQRHGHGARCLVQQIAPGIAHERAEGRRQRAASFVLERVNDVSRARLRSRRHCDRYR